jgi:DNA-binding transcriptional LysR family regulator
MDWDRLKTFYTVASLGSLSAAEQILHITQSALSRQISQLEHEMKTKLFERHARGLKLTEAGKSLFPTVKQIYEELVKMQAMLTEKQDKAEGSLTVITPRSFGSFWLIPHLAEFRQRFPNIRLSLISDEMISLNHSLREGVYVQISSFKPSDPAELEAYHLCEYSQYIFAGKEYLKRYGTPKSIPDIDNHSLIAFNHQALLVSIDERQLNPLLYTDRPHHKPRRPDFVVDDIHSKLVATQSNLGLSTMPLYLVSKDQMVERIHIDGVDFSQSILTNKFLLYPDYLKDFERIKVFKSFIEEKAHGLKTMEANTRIN